MTSSTRRPVSGDLITHGSGSLSPARHPTGTQYQSHVGRNTTSAPSGPGCRPREVTSRQPFCAHVTSQLLPVVDEDAIRSSGTTSSPKRCRLSSSSRPTGDATYQDVPLPSTAFPHLGRASGSDFATWCPTTLRAFTAALQGRGAVIPSRDATPDTFLPFIRAPPPEWPRPELRRRITVKDAAELITRRRKRSTDLEVDDVRLPQTPVPPLLLAPPTWRQPYHQRRTPADDTTDQPPRLIQREPSRTAEPGINERGLRAADVLLFDTHSTRTLSHVSGLDPPPAALSLWSSLLASQPRNLLSRPSSALNDLPNHLPHHHSYHHTGRRI